MAGQLEHSLGRFGVTLVSLGAQRGEDHGEVRGWRGVGDHEGCPVEAWMNARTRGGKVPLSAARSGWNRVATKNG